MEKYLEKCLIKPSVIWIIETAFSQLLFIIFRINWSIWSLTAWFHSWCCYQGASNGYFGLEHFTPLNSKCVKPKMTKKINMYTNNWIIQFILYFLHFGLQKFEFVGIFDSRLLGFVSPNLCFVYNHCFVMITTLLWVFCAFYNWGAFTGKRLS